MKLCHRRNRWAAVRDVAFAMHKGAKPSSFVNVEPYTCEVNDVVEALLSGDAAKWPVLVADVHALALTVCARRQASRGSDFASNVALRVIERLQNDDYETLRRFIELRQSYQSLSFEKWLRGIINNALIDELRSLPTVSRSRTSGGRELRQRAHLLYEEEQHASNPSTAQGALLDARRILRWIHDEGFPEEQRRALLLWLHGHSIADCSARLDQDESATRRLLSAARQRLRRHFKDQI